MASIFTKIINGEIPAYKVAEDEHFLAFLDISPLTEGHTLVIPKKEVDYLFDLDNDTYMALHMFAKKVAIGLKKAIPCERIGTSIIGLEVPHAHIHLIPMNSMKDVNFANPKLKLSSERMVEIANSISKELT